MKIAVVTDDHNTICAHFGRGCFLRSIYCLRRNHHGLEPCQNAAHNQSANEPHAEPGFAYGQGSGKKTCTRACSHPSWTAKSYWRAGWGRAPTMA